MAVNPRLSPVSELLAAFRDMQSREEGTADVAAEGLRQRKKRVMRQMISDTATAMFLERGFEEVRVAEVAAACDVSEKTVYNYFPTKESLLLDREEAMTAAVNHAFGPGSALRSPIEAAVDLIAHDLHHLYSHVEAHDPPLELVMVQRFSELVERTPALRAAHQDMMERLVDVAAEAMAARAGMDPGDPEPQIAAHAILGLWRVQFRAMRRYSDGTRPPSEVCDLVVAEVRRAARLIDTGLWSFGMAVQGANGREQLRAAAESANDARKQVVTALRQAKAAWRQVAEAHGHDVRDPSGRGRGGSRGHPDRGVSGRGHGGRRGSERL